MLWALPAATVRLIRWRWLAVIAAAGVIVVLVIAGAQRLQADREQSALNAACQGPGYMPATSPGSPLDGYRLRSVKLPNAFDTYVGATQISLSYVRPDTGLSNRKYHTIDFSTGQHALLLRRRLRHLPDRGNSAWPTRIPERILWQLRDFFGQRRDPR